MATKSYKKTENPEMKAEEPVVAYQQTNPMYMQQREVIHKKEEGLGLSMLPFVMRELVELVMKKKILPLEDALHYIYSSRLYKSLLDENTKLWYSSTLSLYDTLEKEKSEDRKRQIDDTKILLFKMFCMENFREAKKQSAEEVLLLFSNHGVFEFIDRNFEMLHTQDSEYILDTIATYIKKK